MRTLILITMLLMAPAPSRAGDDAKKLGKTLQEWVAQLDAKDAKGRVQACQAIGDWQGDGAPAVAALLTTGKEAGAPGLFQVGEQLVEVVAGQVAADRLQGLAGAPPQSRDDGRHEADGVAPLRGAQVQDGDRLRGGRQRQVRDGVVHPVLDGLDRGQLRPRVLVVVSRAFHPRRCWHDEHLIRFPLRILLPLLVFDTIGGVTPAQEGGAAPSPLALGATTPTHPAHGEW